LKRLCKKPGVVQKETFGQPLVVNMGVEPPLAAQTPLIKRHITGRDIPRPFLSPRISYNSLSGGSIPNDLIPFLYPSD
jgi:hypothetical protein